MEIKQPKTQKDLDHLRCWLGERLLLVSLVVPLCVLFLSFLSYLLLEGCTELSKYTNTLSVLPMELKNVKTVLYSFAYSFILINTGFILFIILAIPLLFCHNTKLCMISEIKSPQKSIVWSGIRDFTILDNSDIKYRLRRRNILKFWKTKFPKTMMFAAFLFWIIITSMALCVTQFITGKATVMMWLNLPVLALMISVLRLITNNDLFLLRFYISTYKKILPDTEEEDADDESDAEDDIPGEAGEGESFSCFGNAGDGESWDVSDTECAFAVPAVTNLHSGNDALGNNADDIVVGIDDVYTEDNRFGGDLNFDCGSDSE